MPSAGGLYLTRGCHFSNLRHVCGDSFHALRCPGASGGGKWKFMSDLCKLSFLSPAPAFASPLACLSRVHFSRYPSNGELARSLSDLHLILMFSGPLQQDLFKKSEVWRNVVSNKIIVTLVTQGLPSFSLPRPRVNTRNVSLGFLWCEGHFIHCTWRISFLCDSLWRMIQR